MPPQHDGTPLATDLHVAELGALEPWDDDGNLNVVIETPRGSSAKLAYDPAHHAPDGDPLDVLVLLDVATFPGVVVACRPVGLVRASQAKPGARRRIRNDRIIAVAREDRRHGGVKEARELSERERDEIDLFFQTAVALEHKELVLEGWGSAREAQRVIDQLTAKKKRRP